jgi:hypothetical protein
MENRQRKQSSNANNATGGKRPEGNGRTPWQEPRLKFVEPTLTERGTVKDLTGGFFGTFSPR